MWRRSNRFRKSIHSLLVIVSVANAKLLFLHFTPISICIINYYLYEIWNQNRLRKILKLVLVLFLRWPRLCSLRLDRCCQWTLYWLHRLRVFSQYRPDSKSFRSHSSPVDDWVLSNLCRCAWYWWLCPSMATYSRCPRHFEWIPMKLVRCPLTLVRRHLSGPELECYPNRNDFRLILHRRMWDRLVHVYTNEENDTIGLDRCAMVLNLNQNLRIRVVIFLFFCGILIYFCQNPNLIDHSFDDISELDHNQKIEFFGACTEWSLTYRSFSVPFVELFSAESIDSVASSISMPPNGITDVESLLLLAACTCTNGTA